MARANRSRCSSWTRPDHSRRSPGSAARSHPRGSGSTPSSGFPRAASRPRVPPPRDIWEWQSGAGWSRVPGSEDIGPNGIELSRDGEWYYVGGYAAQALIRLSRNRTPPEQHPIPVDHYIDNVRWGAGNTLLAAGHIGPTRASIGECIRGGNCDGRQLASHAHRPRHPDRRGDRQLPVERSAAARHRRHRRGRRDLGRPGRRGGSDRALPGAVGTANAGGRARGASVAPPSVPEEVDLRDWSGSPWWNSPGIPPRAPRAATAGFALVRNRSAVSGDCVGCSPVGPLPEPSRA